MKYFWTLHQQKKGETVFLDIIEKMRPHFFLDKVAFVEEHEENRGNINQSSGSINQKGRVQVQESCYPNQNQGVNTDLRDAASQNRWTSPTR